jgi:hypothetical protein
VVGAARSRSDFAGRVRQNHLKITLKSSEIFGVLTDFVDGWRGGIGFVFLLVEFGFFEDEGEAFAFAEAVGEFGVLVVDFGEEIQAGPVVVFAGDGAMDGEGEVELAVFSGDGGLDVGHARADGRLEREKGDVGGKVRGEALDFFEGNSEGVSRGGGSFGFADEGHRNGEALGGEDGAIGSGEARVWFGEHSEGKLAQVSDERPVGGGGFFDEFFEVVEVGGDVADAAFLGFAIPNRGVDVFRGEFFLIGFCEKGFGVDGFEGGGDFFDFGGGEPMGRAVAEVFIDFAAAVENEGKRAGSFPCGIGEKEMDAVPGFVDVETVFVVGIVFEEFFEAGWVGDDGVEVGVGDAVEKGDHAHGFVPFISFAKWEPPEGGTTCRVLLFLLFLFCDWSGS